MNEEKSFVPTLTLEPTASAQAAVQAQQPEETASEAPVEKLEGTVENRHKCGDKADKRELFCPVLFLASEESDNARHREHRQISGDGRPSC